MDMDIGLKYQAVKQGRIDAMIIFTTDGQLSTSDVSVLKDDRQFYPSYLCGNVVRSEVVKDHPELLEVLEKVTGILTDARMSELNNKVEAQGMEPKEVAERLLEDAGLLR